MNVVVTETTVDFKNKQATVNNSGSFICKVKNYPNKTDIIKYNKTGYINYILF